MGKKIIVFLLFLINTTWAINVGVLYPINRDKENVIKNYLLEYENENREIKIFYFNTEDYKFLDFVSAIEKLKEFNISAIIGGYTTNETLIILGILRYYKLDIPLISLFSTSTFVQENKNFYSLVFSNSLLAEKISNILEENKKLYIIYDEKDFYSKDLVANLEKKLLKKKPRVIEYIKISKKDDNLFKNIDLIIKEENYIIPIFSKIETYNILNYYLNKTEKNIKSIFILPDGFFVSVNDFENYIILKNAFWLTYYDVRTLRGGDDSIIKADFDFIKLGLELVRKNELRKMNSRFLSKTIFYYKFHNNKIVFSKIL